MKKILVTCLILLHFVASSGMLLSHHFCGGEYVATQFDLSQGIIAQEMCDGCGMDTEEDDACCEEKIQLIKKTIELQHDQHQVWDFFLSIFDLPKAQVWSKFSSSFVLSVVHQAIWRVQMPPPKGISRYIEICCFRI